MKWVLVGGMSVAVVAAVLVAVWVRPWGGSWAIAPEGGVDRVLEADDVAEVIQEIKKLDETVWKQEQLAQEYEQTFVALWDRLRPEEDKYDPLAEFPFATITIGTPAETLTRENEILVHKFVPGGPGLDHGQWRDFLREFQNDGFEIVETEWHHSRFDWRPPQPVRSTVSYKLHIRRPETKTRYVVRGDLTVVWSDQVDDDGHHIAAELDAGRFEIHEHAGPPRFEKVLTLDPRDGDPPRGITGVLLSDLNHDGLPELVLPGQNRVYWNRGEFRFEPERLIAGSAIGTHMSLIADLTGDGYADLLTTRPQIGLFLFHGDADGRFLDVPHQINAVPPLELVQPMVLTAGDIDADGDLDVWLGQWMDPYSRAGGKMPATFYDANDSHPAYLLLNEGDGRLIDATDTAGLAPKRRRRTFSGSFVDLDADRDLDLAVVSDFAGVDLYTNDGAGRFTDVTEELIDEPYNFGMSLTVSDFNLDSRLDFLVVGMSSTTARRLEAMGLGPSFRTDITAKRSQMGYGNRLYLAEDGRFVQAPFNDHIARSGWSWGSTPLDFDNDGDQDVYIANGFWSGQSAKDYCTRFWCHDIYLGGDEATPAIDGYFEQLKIFPEWSWNPFEKNCLFINDSGEDFFEAGFLMDVALNVDARQVVSGDLDADGHMDLIVAELVLSRQPFNSYLHILRNLGSLEGERHWIGVHLDDRTPGVSPIGAVVRVASLAGVQVAPVVTGDAYLAQHALTKHFGLGARSSVDSIEVHWPNETVARIANPAINTYHWVSPPGREQ